MSTFNPRFWSSALALTALIHFGTAAYAHDDRFEDALEASLEAQGYDVDDIDRVGTTYEVLAENADGRLFKAVYNATDGGVVSFQEVANSDEDDDDRDDDRDDDGDRDDGDDGDSDDNESDSDDSDSRGGGGGGDDD